MYKKLLLSSMLVAMTVAPRISLGGGNRSGVLNFYQMDTSGNTFIGSSIYNGGAPSCQTGSYMSFSTATPAGKAMAVVVNAITRKKKVSSGTGHVTLIGAGTCTNAPNAEDLAYVAYVP